MRGSYHLHLAWIDSIGLPPDSTFYTQELMQRFGIFMLYLLRLCTRHAAVTAANLIQQSTLSNNRRQFILNRGGSDWGMGSGERWEGFSRFFIGVVTRAGFALYRLAISIPSILCPCGYRYFVLRNTLCFETLRELDTGLQCTGPALATCVFACDNCSVGKR